MGTGLPIMWSLHKSCSETDGHAAVLTILTETQTNSATLSDLEVLRIHGEVRTLASRAPPNRPSISFNLRQQLTTLVFKPLSYKVGVDPTHSALKTRSKKQESLKYHYPEPLLPEECLPTPAATATSATTALRGRQSPGLSAAEASGLR